MNPLRAEIEQVLDSQPKPLGNTQAQHNDLIAALEELVKREVREELLRLRIRPQSYRDSAKMLDYHLDNRIDELNQGEA